jgi:hypothetical protein
MLCPGPRPAQIFTGLVDSNQGGPPLCLILVALAVIAVGVSPSRGTYRARLVTDERSRSESEITIPRMGDQMRQNR